MKTLFAFLREEGIAKSITFDYAAYKLSQKLQPIPKQFDGARLRNEFGDVTSNGLVIVHKPCFTLIAMANGDVKGVPISDFISFLRSLNSIELGNLKSGCGYMFYGEKIKLMGTLPFGYFHYLKKDKEFHFQILAEWGKQGLTNKELIALMKKYLRARVRWKWEFYKEIPKYLEARWPKSIFLELSQAQSHAVFDETAKKWGLDELCKSSLARKTAYARLIYELK